MGSIQIPHRSLWRLARFFVGRKERIAVESLEVFDGGSGRRGSREFSNSVCGTCTRGPNFTCFWGNLIQDEKNVSGAPVIAYQGTSFFGVWYLNRLLQQDGIQVQWDLSKSHPFAV